MDIINRYERGEFFSQDSIHQNDSLVYKTGIGRTVYGGGGIMPDIFVPGDSAKYTPYLTTIINKRLLAAFTFKYSKENRSKLATFKRYQDIVAYMKENSAVEEFIKFAAEKGVELPAEQATQSRKMLVEPLNANIIYNILGMLEHVKYINLTDETVLKAVEVLNEGKAFPIMPTDTAGSND